MHLGVRYKTWPSSKRGLNPLPKTPPNTVASGWSRKRDVIRRICKFLERSQNGAFYLQMPLWCGLDPRSECLVDYISDGNCERDIYCRVNLIVAKTSVSMRIVFWQQAVAQFKKQSYFILNSGFLRYLLVPLKSFLLT